MEGEGEALKIRSLGSILWAMLRHRGYTKSNGNQMFE